MVNLEDLKLSLAEDNIGDDGLIEFSKALSTLKNVKNLNLNLGKN